MIPICPNCYAECSDKGCNRCKTYFRTPGMELKKKLRKKERSVIPAIHKREIEVARLAT